MNITSALFLLIGLVAVVACTPDNGTLPDSIEDLQALQKEKKDAIADLQGELKQIQDKMEEVQPGIFEAEPKLITTIPVTQGEFKRYISIQGGVQAGDELLISSESAGRLRDVRIEEGDYVRKGQLVAQVDLESLRKQKEEVEKNLELANDIYQRQKNLWEKNIGSEVEYLQAKNRVESLEKSIASIEHQLSKSNIYAPMSGEIADVMGETGEVVAPGEPIARLLNNSTVKVSAEIPERYITAVKRGDKVIVAIPSIDLEEEKTVTRVGSTIDPDNRSFTVEVELPNRERILKPNLVANMKINDITREDVLTVPTNLVQQEVSGQYFVYVLKEDGERPHAQKKYVHTGESYEGMIVIEDGLQGDAILIDKGARNVSAGEPVKILSKPADTTGLTSKK